MALAAHKPAAVKIGLIAGLAAICLAPRHRFNG
jgi:hypothetical protein